MVEEWGDLRVFLTLAREGNLTAAARRLAVSHPTVARRIRRTNRHGPTPPLSVLKPLHGDEPLLEEALASLCAQDYPEFQIVFGADLANREPWARAILRNFRMDGDEKLVALEDHLLFAR